jgi:phosphatidylinositol alpha-1,6-mannosyltransferase
MKSSPSMLAIVTDAFGGRGGIAQYNRDFLGALVRTGAVSSITIVPRHAPDESVLPEKVEQQQARPGRAAYSLAAIRTALLRRVDIVFCGHLFMAPLGAMIKRIKEAKLIVQMHGIEAWPKPSRAQRAAVEAADLVLCVSRHTRAIVLSWAAINPERVVVLPNTVREMFTPGDGSTRRACLGLKNKRILLSVSRLDSRQRYKGQDRVIAVIPDLVAKGYDVHYLIVGEGGDRERLENLARSLHVSDRVHFLGPIGIQSLVETYRAADLFVLASTGEGFGIVFLEAMTSGTPTLGLDIAGAKDALANGELGRLTSERELGLAIASLLDQPRPLPEQLASAVQSRFGSERFTAGAYAAVNRLSESALP